MREGVARWAIGRNLHSGFVARAAQDGSITTEEGGGEARSPTGNDEARGASQGRALTCNVLASQTPKQARDGGMPASPSFDHKGHQTGTR